MASTKMVETSVASTIAGQARITMGLRPSTMQAPLRVDLKLEIPVEVTDADTGVVSVSETPLFQCRFIYGGGASALTRADLLAMARALLASTAVEAYVENAIPVLS
jgi:hypothetical protein